MMNSVLSYIHSGLYWIYYAFYVLLEGLFKISHSWAPIISITGIMSVLVAFPLLGLIRISSLYWANWDIPAPLTVVFGIIIYLGLYWLTYHYYFTIQKSIEDRFQNDNIYKKVLFGIIAIALIGLSFYMSDILFDIYLKKWKNLTSLCSVIPFRNYE